MLPLAYRDLTNPDNPKMIREAIKLYGIAEAAGADFNNDVITGWADEIGGWIADFYERDSIPWCGLFVGIVAKRAGKPVKQDMLGARNWLKWCTARPKKSGPRLGDVLVFWRGSPNGGSGHVGFYVGEDETHYHVLGGNQSDAVNVMRITKERLLGIRYHYTYGAPRTAIPIARSADGALESFNEA